LAITIVVVIVIFVYKTTWHNSADTAKSDKGEVMVATFISLYAAFIAGFGILVGFVSNSKGTGVAWKVVAIILLIETTGLDLYRVLNGSYDLYDATAGGLSYYQLNDDVHDFAIYFFVNVGVVAVALLAACLPQREKDVATG
jgi:hypothetical protein